MKTSIIQSSLIRLSLIIILALFSYMPVSAKKQVYISSKSAYFHKNRNCTAIAKCKDVKVVFKKEAKKMGKKKCPTCGGKKKDKKGGNKGKKK